MSQVTLEHKYDVKKIREDFPILRKEVNGHPLAYFDNAATTQKPESVINGLVEYYSSYNANIHRGVHTLADRATQAFEKAREAAGKFINAPSSEEIIFTSGTTESINLVAHTYCQLLKPGNEILISGMEHHSNIVPWQIAADKYDLKLRVVKFNSDGELDLDDFNIKLSDQTKIVALVYASNSLGTVNPIENVIKKAHDAGAVVLIDGAQAAPHLEIDVQKLDCDFFAFSGHKMYGPTGVGILYGKKEILENIPPYQGGGEMISEVTFAKTTYNEVPYKFEAGTPNIADVVGFHAAVEYLENVGKSHIRAYEQELLNYATEGIRSIKGVQIIGQALEKVSVLSFNFENIHPYDVGMMLDARGVAVRTGHHCTQPVMDTYGIEGTVRASFGMYNTREEIDQMITGLEKVRKIIK